MRGLCACAPKMLSACCTAWPVAQVREILAFGTADHVGARLELEEFAMQVGHCLSVAFYFVNLIDSWRTRVGLEEWV